MSGLCPIVKYVVFAAIEDHFRCGWMALAPIGEWDFLNTRILAAARRRQRDAINRPRSASFTTPSRNSCAIRRLANLGTITIKASTAMDSLHRIF